MRAIAIVAATFLVVIVAFVVIDPFGTFGEEDLPVATDANVGDAPVAGAGVEEPEVMTDDPVDQVGDPESGTEDQP